MGPERDTNAANFCLFHGKKKIMFVMQLSCANANGNLGSPKVLRWSALDSGSSGPGSGPGHGTLISVLGKPLYSHGASLHLVV